MTVHQFPMQAPLNSEELVLGYLRELQALPRPNHHADVLMDKISFEFMRSSANVPTARRRAYALLRIAAEVAE